MISYQLFLLAIFKRFPITFLLVVILLFCFSSSVLAQSLTGTTGYYNIPSAELYGDKTMYVGANYLDRNYLEWTNFKYPGVAFFATINYLPWAEISIRFSRMVDRTPGMKSVGDRMASARFQPLKERKYHPSVVIGFQNFFTTLSSGDASHFNSSYVVLTKNFKLPKIIHNLGITFGYGSDFMAANDYQFIGFFGGIKITPKAMEFLEFMLEYDADKLNIGTRITIFKHVVVLAGYEGFNYFSGGISYKFKLP